MYEVHITDPATDTLKAPIRRYYERSSAVLSADIDKQHYGDRAIVTVYRKEYIA